MTPELARYLEEVKKALEDAQTILKAVEVRLGKG